MAENRSLPLHGRATRGAGLEGTATAPGLAQGLQPRQSERLRWPESPAAEERALLTLCRDLNAAVFFD